MTAAQNTSDSSNHSENQRSPNISSNFQPIHFSLSKTRTVKYAPDDGIRDLAVAIDHGGNTYEGIIEERNGITYLIVRTLPVEGGIGKVWVNKLGDGKALSSLQHLHLALAIFEVDLIITCIGSDVASTGPTPQDTYRATIKGAILSPAPPPTSYYSRR